jgi:hypothetical protein
LARFDLGYEADLSGPEIEQDPGRRICTCGGVDHEIQSTPVLYQDGMQGRLRSWGVMLPDKRPVRRCWSHA